MTSFSQTRPMSRDERAQLEALASGSRPSLRELISMFLWPWAGLVGIFGLLWVFSAWLGRVLFDLRFGLDSHWAPVIGLIGFGACSCLIGYAVLQQRAAGGSGARSVAADLLGDVVEEQRLELVKAKRFQEPEHGGLIYFFLTEEGRVFVLYDDESQDLGVSGADPLRSPFRPCRVLTLVRAPKSRLVLAQVFFGAPLELSAPLELRAKPGRWPVSDEYCKTQWNRLEAEFGG